MKSTNFHTIIEAENSSSSFKIKELWKFKDLFYTLAYRDLRIRYAQTFLGLFWAFLQPALTLLVISVVFGRFIKVDTDGIPYPLFSMAGISLWIYFSFVLSQSGSSIINAQEMVKKIYFPRLIIPLSKAVVGLVDFLVALLLMSLLFVFYGVLPSQNIVYFPFFILLTIISSLAFGIWLSALTVRFRDFQYVVPFIIQFGLYITPIAYPTSMVHEFLPKWAVAVYYLNPMAGITDGFRWSLFGTNPPDFYFWISIAFTVFMFLSAILYFVKTERKMADWV